MDEKNKPMVFIDDDLLSKDIQKRLAQGGVAVDLSVIRSIMKYQSNNYENLGIIRIVYRKP